MTSGKPSANRVLGLLTAFLATSMVAGVLAAGLGIPFVGATGVAARNSVAFFDSLPADLKTPPLAQQSTVVDADGHVMAHFYDENRVEVTFAQIAPVMRQAIVAIEDSRFYEHGGVDPKGLLRAFLTNQFSGKIQQGASTLTQQYVKNVQVEAAAEVGDEAGISRATEKSNARKLREIKLAISMEKELSKDEILRRYLNIAYFGDQVYGVEAAARYFFNTSAKKLTLPQAALLAGLVQSPAEWSPRNHATDSVNRRNVVLRRMYDLHMIDQANYEAAVATKLQVTLTKSKNGCANAGYNGYFCDYLEQFIVKSKSFSSLGATEEERQKALRRGGLTIRTTLKPTIQAAAWSALTKAIPPGDKSGIGTAAVTIEPLTGKILAIAQNRVYDPGGGRGRTTVDYATDYAYGRSSGFQTGSTFKPFTLATWLKKGKSLNDVVAASDEPIPVHDFTACDGKIPATDIYHYGNAEGGGSGAMPVLSATYNSVNTAYIHIEKQLDLCDIRDTAMSMGVRLAAPRKPECSLKFMPKGTVEDVPTTGVPGCQPSMTLGAKELSPMTMAAAFATFASGGVYCTPIAVTSITDRNGKPLAIPKSSCKQVLDKDVAAGVTYALKRVLTQGTAARVGPLKVPSAGKTGTTNDLRDTWFVGYTAQRSTAVWVGDPELNNGKRKTLRNITIGGKHYSRVYGATIAAPIWKKIMTKAQEGLPKKDFSGPPAKMLQGSGVKVPNVAGFSVSRAISILQGAGFRPSVGGTANSKYPAGTVAYTSPGAGSRTALGGSVTITVSLGPGFGNGGGNGRGGGIFPPPNP